MKRNHGYSLRYILLFVKDLSQASGGYFVLEVIFPNSIIINAFTSLRWGSLSQNCGDE
jgi:hypothetical protein